MHNIQAAMPGESKGLLLLALILSLAFPIASLNHYPQNPAVGFPLGFPGLASPAPWLRSLPQLHTMSRSVLLSPKIFPS